MDLNAIFLRAEQAEGVPHNFKQKYKSVHYDYNLEFGGSGTIVFSDYSSKAFYVEGNVWYDAMDYYPDKSSCCDGKPELYKLCHGSSRVRDKVTKEILVKCCDQRYIIASDVWVTDTYLGMREDMEITSEVTYDLLRLYGNLPDNVYDRYINPTSSQITFNKLVRPIKKFLDENDGCTIDMIRRFLYTTVRQWFGMQEIDGYNYNYCLYIKHILWVWCIVFNDIDELRYNLLFAKGICLLFYILSFGHIKIKYLNLNNLDYLCSYKANKFPASFNLWIMWLLNYHPISHLKACYEHEMYWNGTIIIKKRD